MDQRRVIDLTFRSLERDDMTTEAGRPHHHVAFAVLTAGIVTYSLLQSLVTPVLPTIQSELHTGQSTRGRTRCRGSTTTAAPICAPAT